MFRGLLACPRSAGPGLVPGPTAASLPSGHTLFSTEALSGLWTLRSMCSGSGFLQSWVLVFQVCSDVTSLSVFSFLARGQPDLSLFLCSSRHVRVRLMGHLLSITSLKNAAPPGAGRGPGTHEADN